MFMMQSSLLFASLIAANGFKHVSLGLSEDGEILKEKKMGLFSKEKEKITVELDFDGKRGQTVDYQIHSNTFMIDMVTDFSQLVISPEQRWIIRGVELDISLHGLYLISDGSINIKKGDRITLRRKPFYPGGGGYWGASRPLDEEYDDAQFDSVSTAPKAIEAVFRKFKNNKNYYNARECIQFFLPNTRADDSHAIQKRFRNMKAIVHRDQMQNRASNIAESIVNDPEFSTFAGAITGCINN